jgi:hypothetical protein
MHDASIAGTRIISPSQGAGITMNSTTATAQPSGLSRQQWWVIAACVALLLGLQLWLFRPIIGDYFPTFDETAVQTGSTPIGGSINPVL